VNNVDRIGKYELRSVIGRGGMGTVYRAYDPLMDREVAIKVIHEKSLESQDTRARFVREARTAGKLSHENITVIHDFGDIDGKTFIVMEYLDGTDLRVLIDKHEPLTLREKISYATQICRGLHYAHANLIIHRDIKPENIKVLRDGRVKIMDFGIAKPYAPTTDAESFETNEVLTRMGMRIGTPWYMSPEQVKGLAIDKRSDIFSFGVLLYELLTYARPFDGDDTTVLYKILHVEPDPIRLEDSGLNAGLQKILSRCLAKDVDERYADCMHVLRDLEAIPRANDETVVVQELIKQGKQLVDEDRANEATMIFEEILARDPENREAQTSLLRLTGAGEESITLKVLTGRIIGEVISHFQIIDKIGSGGMGVVYKAEDITLKRIVALKFLPPDRTQDQTGKKRFLKEAQAASALDHPNICAVHEISETHDGLVFICMAYYLGEDLRSKIKDNPLDVPTALTIAIGIARGLAVAHESGIIHRDIKPGNIIITRDGVPKIVDFGLAKLTGATKLTRVGAALGTLPYMSPEQIKSKTQDHRTDIWSLGVLIYQTLTGALPFEGEYEAAIAHSILHEPPVPLRQRRPELPAVLDRIITGTLKKEPEERYPTMNDLIADLERVYQAVAPPRPTEFTRSTECARLVDSGKLLMERQEFGEALSRFEAALRLSPGDRRVSELRDQCFQKMGAEGRIARALDEARGLLEKRNFREAEEKVQGILVASPGHPAAMQLVEEVKKHLEHLEGVEKLVSDGEFYLRRGKIDEAAACFARALETDPSNKAALRGAKRIEKERLQLSKKRIASTPVPGLAPRRSAWVWAGGVVAVLAVAALVYWLYPRPSTVTGAPPGVAAPVDSTSSVTPVREQMVTRKGEAAGVNAVRWAPALADSAAKAEWRADRALAERRYAASKEEYIVAGELYGRARDEAQKNEAAQAGSLTDLQDLVKKAHEDMRKERTSAESAGARRLVPALFLEAVAEETTGDKKVGVGTRESLLAARNSYASARDRYTGIQLEAIRLTELKREADARRGDMTAAKKGINATEQEKNGSGGYRNALSLESQADRLYRAGDYQGARDWFAQAGKLYAGAGDEIAGTRAGSQTAAAPSKPLTDVSRVPAEDPARKEKDLRDAADRDFKIMLDTYKDALERGDAQGLAALLRLNDEGRAGWSEFFGLSENRRVTIGGVESEITDQSARLRFRMKLSYLNKTTNSTKDDEYLRTWTMERDAHGWRIVTQK
jgi:serine/threonine protein kinase